MITNDSLILSVGGNAKQALGEVEKALGKVEDAAKGAAEETRGVGAASQAFGDMAKGAVAGAIGAYVTQLVEGYKLVGEYAKSALQAAIADSDAATASSERLSIALDDVQLSLGRAMLGADEGVGILDEFSASVERLSSEINANAESIGSAFDEAVTVAKYLAAILVSTTSIAVGTLAVVIDGVVLAVTSLNVGFLAIKTNALTLATTIAELGQQLGILSADTLNDLKASTKEAKQEFDNAEVSSAGLTSALLKLNETVWDSVTAEDALNESISGGTKLMHDANKALNEQLRVRFAQLSLTAPEEDRIRLIGESTKALREANEEYSKWLAGESAPAAAKGGGGASADELTHAQRVEAIELRLARAREKTTNSIVAEEMARAEYDEGIQARAQDAMTAIQKRNDELANAVSLHKEATAGADVQAMQGAWDSAFSSMQSGVLGLTVALMDMSVQIALGNASWSELGATALSSLGSMFSTIGQGLLLSGLGLQGLFSGNPAAAIATGAGLILVGSALGAFGSAAGGGAGASGSSSSAGAAELRTAARDFIQRKGDSDPKNQTLVVQIGTREIHRELTDLFRRGLIRTGGRA